MRVCSILALLVAMALPGCVVNGDDDDDDVADDSSDSSDDSSDSSDDSSDSSDDSSDDGSDDSSDDGASLEPRTGVWDYSDYNPVDNDCNIPNDFGNGGGGFGLVNNGDGTFTVIPNDGTDPFDCSMDGPDFSCPDRATEEVVADPAYDAILVGQATAEGTFSDPENATGSQTVIIQCEGDDCGLLELATGADFPCTLGVSFTIDWRSDP